jgi:hypothetical protein
MMLSHANVSRAMACIDHSNFFKVIAPKARPGQLRLGAHRRQKGRVGRCSRKGRSAAPAQGPTMSFLIATTSIYTVGAGITVAADTRLALHWILVKGFRLYSFQLPDTNASGNVIYCHYLPVSGLGNLYAYCLPWMW